MSHVSTTTANTKPLKEGKKNVAIHLVAGGIAGGVEALSCHPLDTIKVRLQLRGERNALAKALVGSKGGLGPKIPVLVSIFTLMIDFKASNSFIAVGKSIVKKEGVLSLYKGIGAVLIGIVPKMSIRFASFELFKDALANADTGKSTNASIFLGAGVTEAVLVVTPMDVLKIRLQAQRHSMTDPLDIPKYRNAAHCAYVMIKEEGAGSLYKGVGLTALRQSTNQAANFTVYQFLKGQLHEHQPSLTVLPWYQLMVSGFISGACGPLFNAPIDTIKTRIQKSASPEKGWTRFRNVTTGIMKNEGWRAFYRGLVPRVLRVAPGQAITFMVYEKAYSFLVDLSKKFKADDTLEKVGFGSNEL